MELSGIFWCQECHAKGTELYRNSLTGRLICKDRLACLFVQAHESSPER